MTVLKIKNFILFIAIAIIKFSYSKHLLNNKKGDLPITVNSRVNWGENSIFNSNILLEATENDTIYQIKKKITTLTGIPILSQRLYLITNGNIDYGKGQITGDTTLKQIQSTRQKLATTNNKTPLEFQLDLGAPHLPINFRPAQATPEQLADLLAMQQRIGTLLQKSLYIKKNWDSYKTLQLEQLSEKLCFENFDTHHLNMASFINHKAKILGIIKPDDQKEVEAEAKIAPLELNLFQDYPTPSHDAVKRLKETIAMNLFTDFRGLMKFIVLSQLLRATGEYCDEVNTLLKIAPVAFFISQTRPGSMALRVLLRAFPWRYVPGALLQILPAPLAKSLL